MPTHPPIPSTDGQLTVSRALAEQLVNAWRDRALCEPGYVPLPDEPGDVAELAGAPIRTCVTSDGDTVHTAWTHGTGPLRRWEWWTDDTGDVHPWQLVIQLDDNGRHVGATWYDPDGCAEVSTVPCYGLRVYAYTGPEPLPVDADRATIASWYDRAVPCVHTYNDSGNGWTRDVRPMDGPATDDTCDVLAALDHAFPGWRSLDAPPSAIVWSTDTDATGDAYATYTIPGLRWPVAHPDVPCRAMHPDTDPTVAIEPWIAAVWAGLRSCPAEWTNEWWTPDTGTRADG